MAADQRQSADALRRLRRYLGGDPAPERTTDEVNAVEPQAVHEFEIKMRNVIDAIEPERQSGRAEARV
jgi:hypothetical protein